MTTAARDMRYRNYQSGYAVDGSLAYDLDWAVRERELRHAGETPRHQEQEAAQVKPKVHESPRVQVRERQRVSVVSVIGFAIVIGMAVMVLMGYIQLTVLSADTVALKSQLSALETENVMLTAQYEQIFDLATVREAAEALGMDKPSLSQICYLDIYDGDNVVVYQQQEPGLMDELLASLHHGVYAVVEYFD